MFVAQIARVVRSLVCHTTDELLKSPIGSGYLVAIFTNTLSCSTLL
jgi:hypothetical protein